MEGQTQRPAEGHGLQVAVRRCGCQDQPLSSTGLSGQYQAKWHSLQVGFEVLRLPPKNKLN